MLNVGGSTCRTLPRANKVAQTNDKFLGIRAMHANAEAVTLNRSSLCPQLSMHGLCQSWFAHLPSDPNYLKINNVDLDHEGFYSWVRSDDVRP